MSRKGIIGLAVLVTASAFWIVTPFDETLAQSIRQVFVTNFPDLQKIVGTVEVEGPIRMSTMHSVRNITVAPVEPTETTRLVDAGLLATDGFPNVVLSLHGTVKGSVQKKGTVGAILVPDEERIREGFNERGLMPFALQTAAPGVSSESAYFASSQPRYTVAFPRYRVLLYNTTDKAVSVDFYAYLTY